MKKKSVLILYSLPHPFFPNGSVDKFGPKSVLSRLKAVQNALISLGYKVKTLEMKDTLSTLVTEILASEADFIFNLCEEFLGQSRWEMNLAALLELLNIPFTGSTALILGLSQDKGKTKSILSYHGIPTPAYVVWTPEEKPSLDHLHFPLIVKPLREDASLGISNDALVQDSSGILQQVEMIHRFHHQPALVEEYIDGRELNVSILGNEAPEILPVSEIDFSTMPPGMPRICSYEAKWVEKSREFSHTIPRCPSQLSPDIEKEVKAVSLLAYRVMECRDYARVDIRLSPERIPYVLEVNANPDISPDAGMTRSAAAAGYSYAQMIGRIADLALSRAPTPEPSPEGKPGG